MQLHNATLPYSVIHCATAVVQGENRCLVEVSKDKQVYKWCLITLHNRLGFCDPDPTLPPSQGCHFALNRGYQGCVLRVKLVILDSARWHALGQS